MKHGGRPKRTGGLSAAEFNQVMDFLTRYTVEDIAERLGVSISAVRDYRTGHYAVPERVEKKLGLLVTEKALPESLRAKLSDK